jgi:hypothetical protein
LTITFQVAVDDAIARLNSTRWRTPSIVREGSPIAARQAGETGFRRPGARVAKASRTAWGAVGARSPLQTVVAFSDLNERSSRKKSSRFFPQRKVR